MHIYLPIAEQPINAFIVIGIGSLVGIIMGMVGIGGGFLLTPLMIFLGIPSPVAVASVANQLVAPSVSGVLSVSLTSKIYFAEWPFPSLIREKLGSPSARASFKFSTLCNTSKKFMFSEAFSASLYISLKLLILHTILY